MNIDQTLMQLEHAQLVRATNQIEYAFKHTLTQETVYESLLRSTRRHVHAHVAQVYEELYANQLDEFAAELAQHYAEAGDDAKTFDYSVRAGNTAARVHANAEAITHYSRAIEIVQISPASNNSGAGLKELYLKRGRAYELQGKYNDALENYNAMEQSAHKRNDPAMELAALMARATLRATPTPLQNLAQGRALLDRALALARQLHDRAAESKILWNLMLIEYFGGNVTQAVDCGEQAIAIARELGLREQLAFVLNDISRNYLAVGRAQDAFDALDEARELWRAMDNLPMLADNLGTSADLFFSAGEYTKAMMFAEEAYNVGQSIDNLWNQAYSRWVMGNIHIDQGEWTQGITVLEETMRLGDRSGFVVASWVARIFLALFYGMIGIPERGVAMIEPFAEKVRRMDIPFKAWGLGALSYLYFLSKREAQAQELSAEASQGVNWDDLSNFAPVIIALTEGSMALAHNENNRVLTMTNRLLERYRKLGVHPFKADLMLLAAKALRAQGKIDAAHEMLMQTRDEAETIGVRRVLWEIFAEWGTIEKVRGNRDEAKTWRAKSRAEIEYIAARSPDDVRASFLALPSVRNVMEK